MFVIFFVYLEKESEFLFFREKRKKIYVFILVF